MKMNPLWAAIVFLIPLTTALDCTGKADIVIAVPGSYEAVPDDEFAQLETFLLNLTRYYSIGFDDTRIGIVLYGSRPMVIARLNDANATRLKTRISLMSFRPIYASAIRGGQNVPKVISKVHSLLKSNARSNAIKIGVIMTYGRKDLTSSDTNVVADNIRGMATRALNDNIALFATSGGGTVPGFEKITQDNCRLFSLGSYTHNNGLFTLLPYLGSSLCYLLDPSVNPKPGKCFPELKKPVEPGEFTCPADIDAEHDELNPEADPENCAYFYLCHSKGMVHQKCPPTTLFDRNTEQCNHSRFVSCLSELYCPKEEGIFPHPTDCSRFLVCSKNMPYVQRCAGGTLFNAKTGLCDFSSNVEC